MSIDIDWETLTTGPEGIELASSIRDFIHEKFQQVQLPRFIRSVNVHAFDFGRECPVVELNDISDPLPEFYEEDEDSGEGDDEADDNPGGGRSTPKTMIPPAHIPFVTNGTTSAKPNYIDTHHLLSLRSTQQDHIATPFLSRSSIPGIPGGTSNFSYFHLPLSTAGLSGTQTPLGAAFSPAWHNEQQQQHHLPSSLKHQKASYAVPLSPPPIHYQEPSSGPTPDRSADFQTTLHISYAGTLSLSLTAEILLDYPMPSFVGIPLKLQITGLNFDGMGLLAYLRQQKEGGSGRVCFCFMEGDDGRSVGKEQKHDGGEDKRKGDESSGVGGLLKEIRVESEIGRQENGKQVLKNVGKVEKFVLEQVRRIFEEEFVWPSFWTFLV